MNDQLWGPWIKGGMNDMISCGGHGLRRGGGWGHAQLPIDGEAACVVGDDSTAAQRFLPSLPDPQLAGSF